MHFYNGLSAHCIFLFNHTNIPYEILENITNALCKRYIMDAYVQYIFTVWHRKDTNVVFERLHHWLQINAIMDTNNIQLDYERYVASIPAKHPNKITKEAEYMASRRLGGTILWENSLVGLYITRPNKYYKDCLGNPFKDYVEVMLPQYYPLEYHIFTWSALLYAIGVRSSFFLDVGAPLEYDEMDRSIGLYDRDIYYYNRLIPSVNDYYWGYTLERFDDENIPPIYEEIGGFQNPTIEMMQIYERRVELFKTLNNQYARRSHGETLWFKDATECNTMYFWFNDPTESNANYSKFLFKDRNRRGLEYLNNRLYC